MATQERAAAKPRGPGVHYSTYPLFRVNLMGMINDAEKEKLRIESNPCKEEDQDKYQALGADLDSITETDSELTDAAIALGHGSITEEQERVLNNATWAIMLAYHFSAFGWPIESDTTGRVYYEFDAAFSFAKPSSHQNRDAEVGPKGESVGEQIPPGGHPRVDSRIGQGRTSESRTVQPQISTVFRNTELRPDGTVVEHKDEVWYSQPAANEAGNDESPWNQSQTQTSDNKPWKQTWFN